MFKKRLVILGIIISLLLVGGSSAFAKELQAVSYQTHVQNEGWQDYVSNGEKSGTEGQSLRLEAIKIKLAGYEDVSIRYKTHIENYGWEEEWVSENQVSGTSGPGFR